ncbi:MAG: ABC transporter ATP-binding protein, partial [Candidatus Limnocylindrales bacterium]
TLVLTTHYMDEAEQLCDRLVVMDKATIVAAGSPRELIEQHASREVVEMRFADGMQATAGPALEALGPPLERIEQRPDRVLIYASDGEAAVERVHAAGIRPETSLIRRSSLEDVFLRLTGRTLID